MTEIFNILKSSIKAVIRDNKNQEITGPILQKVLLDIVSTLDVYYPKSTQNLSLRIGTTVFSTDDKGKTDIGNTPFTHVTRGIEPAPGEEVDLGSERQFNQIYAAEFIEGTKSLTSKYVTKDSANKDYATKEEAYDFVNVERAMGLSAAIKMIDANLRQIGQVITFFDDSQYKAAKYAFSVTHIEPNNTDIDPELTLKVGDRDITDTYYPSAEAINSDGTFDYTRINEELFEYIQLYSTEYAPDIVDLTQSYYADGIIYLTLQKGISSTIRVETTNVEKIQYDSVVLQQSSDGQFVSYQYKGASIDDEQYLNIDNWKEYMPESKIFWKGF